MCLQFVPGNGTTAVRPTAIEPRRPALAALGGGGSGHTHRPLRLVGGRGEWPRLSASAFQALAAVGDGARAEGNFYERLGISGGVGFDDIKWAYKLMARKYHPDVSPPDQRAEHTRRFIEVQEAYETLSDPRLRALYDRDLARGLHLSLSARRPVDKEVDKSGWRSRWQDQLSELKRRSRTKDSEGNLSWGDQMRRERAE